MDSPEAREYLGLDLGASRVGMARGNTGARLAQPLMTVQASSIAAELKKQVGLLNAAGVVIGLPRGLDGNNTSQTVQTAEWARRLKEEIDLPFFWQDEALSSYLAEKQPKSPAGADAVAAAIILQDFLDSPESDRVAI